MGFQMELNQQSYVGSVSVHPEFGRERVASAVEPGYGTSRARPCRRSCSVSIALVELAQFDLMQVLGVLDILE